VAFVERVSGLPSAADDGTNRLAMAETLPASSLDDLRSLMHRLNNQLGVILAHAELLEAKAPDDPNRARATQVVSAALEAMSLAREIRSTLVPLE
jgi:hypothetical protein